MWRNIIRSFDRSLVINNKQLVVKHTILQTCLTNIQHTPQRLLTTSTILRNTQTVYGLSRSDAVDDVDYIIPYKPESEKRDSAKRITQTLCKHFHLSPEEIDQILTDDAVMKSCREKSLADAFDTLYEAGITKQNFIEYPWLITLDKKILLQKLDLLKYVNGFRDINDFVPFLRLQLLRLRRLVSSLNREANHITHGNRIYYMAEKLDVLPSTVTKYISRRLFVLEMPLEMFKTILEHMINHNVEPMNILKDLWGFRYGPRAVELRLQRALEAKKDKIMPWMVRCPEPILQRSLQLSLDEIEVLNGKATVAEYVGERLGFSTEEAQVIMNRHPQVNSVRVTKIKAVLDYLLNEAMFTRHEIALVPRILCHSLETTKQRIEELKKYGCKPSSLVIVCLSKREYEKFLTQWQNTYNPNKTIGKEETGTEQNTMD